VNVLGEELSDNSPIVKPLGIGFFKLSW